MCKWIVRRHSQFDLHSNHCSTSTCLNSCYTQASSHIHIIYVCLAYINNNIDSNSQQLQGLHSEVVKTYQQNIEEQWEILQFVQVELVFQRLDHFVLLEAHVLPRAHSQIRFSLTRNC